MGAAPAEFLRTYDKTYLGIVDEHVGLRDLIRDTWCHLCATMDGDVLGSREFVTEFHAGMKGDHAQEPRLTQALQFGSCLQMLYELEFVCDDDSVLFDLQVATDLPLPATIEVSIAGMNDVP